MTYVLITAARNEERFIRLTLESVVAQTIRPLRWIIVNDASTDGTDAIVERFQEQHGWIESIRMPEHRDRSYAAKVHCLAAGLAQVGNLAFEILGCLDADVSFCPDY